MLGGLTASGQPEGGCRVDARRFVLGVPSTTLSALRSQQPANLRTATAAAPRTPAITRSRTSRNLAFTQRLRSARAAIMTHAPAAAQVGASTIICAARSASISTYKRIWTSASSHSSHGSRNSAKST